MTTSAALAQQIAASRREHLGKVLAGKAPLQSLVDEVKNDKFVLYVAGGDAAVQAYQKLIEPSIATLGADTARLFA